jgi:chromosomal replication initiation ATPase DnaA
LLYALILKLLGDRGIAAPAEVAEFLVPRIERSYVGVLKAIDALDRAVLSHHKRLTVPVAKKALVEARLIRRAKFR